MATLGNHQEESFSYASNIVKHLYEYQQKYWKHFTRFASFFVLKKGAQMEKGLTTGNGLLDFQIIIVKHFVEEEQVRFAFPKA
ncbi:CLUMA_CG018386, isoform A [Clunio marinus]|uniref:CLUMA_CG018386, isoform A n=1 Tax=Clunio marinus TaxID=568069 RepID=A0A1J1IZD9_9DIPT|nr:CLUMA_CG018386, isoform A [Clunio marinus]